MRSILTFLLFLALAGPALAGDGVLEINQTCAVNTGCFTGDPPGFPVLITETGSYRLTGNLVVTNPSLSILDIRADHVTIDLNGFAILGPQVCDVGNCASTGQGSAIGSFNVTPFPVNTTVVNGTISGFNGCVVLFAARVHVQRLAISHCTVAGILVGDHGLVLDNRVANVRDSGINMGANTAFRDNVVTNADLSGSGTFGAFDGGRAMGGNVCDDGTCSPRGVRRYYLTASVHDGSSATGACASGYHMASLWEIFTPSDLEYTAVPKPGTATQGPAPDQGSGPPSTENGWVRTGNLDANGTSAAGTDNCLAYASTSGLGTAVGLKNEAWDQGNSTGFNAWTASTPPCSTNRRVWCVED